VNDLDEIYCKAPTPKVQRLQQGLNEHDGREQGGDLDWVAMQARYPRLPNTIKFLRQLASALTVIILLGLVGVVLMWWTKQVNAYEALTLGVALGVGLTFQRALCVLMSEGATIAADCERSLRVQREAMLHLARIVEQHVDQAR
jgi:hypothetical protein